MSKEKIARQEVGGEINIEEKAPRARTGETAARAKTGVSSEEIREALGRAGISVDPEQSGKLLSYMEGVLAWNEHVNLTAIKDPEEFIEKHYADSLAAAELPEYREAKRVIDVGTGGGFPGVPLAIESPDKSFVLADSLNKRLKIIDELAAEIGITNVETVHGRAEDLAQMPEYREAFDLCVSRAVARLSVLAELCLPFVRVGGAFVAYKGESSDEEIAEARGAIEKLGGETERIEKVGQEHILVVIRKKKKTADKYPRKAGTPARNPLR